MKNNLSLIADAVLLSRKMNKIIKQNVIFSIICYSDFDLYELPANNQSFPYGVIGHEGSTILVILNGLRLLKSLK